MTYGLKDLKQESAEYIVNSIPELSEDMIELHLSDSLADVTFRKRDLPDGAVGREVHNKMEEIYRNEFRKNGTDKCPHHSDKGDTCIGRETYQQSAGLGISALGSFSLSGGEIVKVCDECELVLSVISESSVTGN